MTDTPKTEALEGEIKSSFATRNPVSMGEAYQKAITLAYALERELTRRNSGKQGG